MRGRSELAFLLAASAQNPEILVDGVLPEPISLAALMGKGMGAVFVPKFYQFFERYGLHTFAISAGITLREFDELIQVIAQLPGGGGGASGATLNELILDRQIFQVSILYADDLVGRERRMNWRVRLALSRLKKDLGPILLDRQAAGQALLRARVQQIVEEVVRPLARPELLCGLVMHCDLAAPGPGVRARAVGALGALRTQHPGALHFMAETIRRAGLEHAVGEEAVQIQACRAIQQLGNFHSGEGGRIERVLARALVGPKRRGFREAFGAPGDRQKSPVLRAAIIDALSAIGTAASADALRRVAEGEDGPLAGRAREALQQVQSRPTQGQGSATRDEN